MRAVWRKFVLPECRNDFRCIKQLEIPVKPPFFLCTKALEGMIFWLHRGRPFFGGWDGRGRKDDGAAVSQPGRQTDSKDGAFLWENIGFCGECGWRS